jgi:hypothetical protein
LLASLAFAFWPIDWVVCGRYSVEPLYVFLLTLAITILLRLVERPRFGLAAVLGLLMGLASLVREVNVFLPLALALAVPLLPLARGKRLRFFLVLGTALLIAALVMIPWIARGYYLTGAVILPTTGGGLNLYSTASFSKHGGYHGDLHKHVKGVLEPDMLGVLASHGIRENSGDYYSTYWWTFMSLEEECRANEVLKRKAIEEIRENPGPFLRTMLGNVAGFWFRGLSVNMTWVARFLFVPLLVAAAIGFVAAAKFGEKAAWVLVLLIAYLNLLCAGTISFVRYTIPATPALFLLAARGLVCILPWMRRNKHPSLASRPPGAPADAAP